MDKDSKMNLAAIICEFNPLHTGHKRLIDYAKTVADKVVCIMSGNFTQRGLPACADKYARAKHAVMAGADIVVELPTVFATASAENFAIGGVSIANKLNADSLVFGSECGDIALLQHCVDVIEEPDTQKRIKKELSTGFSYPKALALATGTDLLNKPNNILAIEYIRALRSTRSAIIPYTIKREDNYNAPMPKLYASSSMLRENNSWRSKYTYDYVIPDIDEKTEKNYLSYVPVALALATKEKLTSTEGVCEGLENRIINADKTKGYEHMIEQIKTKRYTRLRLQRIFLNFLLGIDKDTVSDYKKSDVPVKVLAADENALRLVGKVENEADLITKRADNFYYALSGNYPIKKLQIIKK